MQKYNLLRTRSAQKRKDLAAHNARVASQKKKQEQVYEQVN